MTGAAEDDGAALIGSRLGLRLDSAAGRRVARSVEAVAARRGVSPELLAELARADPAVLDDLIDHVAVPETSYFRDEAQFDALRRHVLPGLVDPVTIWSAGCSAGQEAYTLAMVLTEEGRTDWRVVATDASPAAVERVRSGWYSEREMAGVGPARRSAHFEREGDGWRVRPHLRERVRPARHNLASDPLPLRRGEVQVILCRNVLIYLRPAVIEALLTRLAALLPRDGALFVGGSESLWHLDHPLVAVRLGDAYAYVHPQAGRAGELGAPAAAPAPPAAEAPPATSPRPPRTTVDGAIATGDAHYRAEDFAAAAAAYRDAVRLDPAAPLPHALLGLALEALGDGAAARDAFRSAWTALEAAEPAAAERGLGGYRAEELARMLLGKLGPRA